MNDYFEGAVRQHIERVEGLIGRIPPDLPREFHALATTCRHEGQRILGELESLLNDTRMRLAEYQPERLRKFRRAVNDLALLEQRGVAALERGTNDKFLNQLVDTIRLETCYPLLPPTICSLSQSYFHIYLPFNLMFIPLSEGDFLLHLPDIYHELAHPLIAEKSNPRTKAFRDSFFAAYDHVITYLHGEQLKEVRRRERAPKSFSFYLQTWQDCWGQWLIELFCDLFATYTIGPAYGWSHFYLCAKMGKNLFAVPTIMKTTHPSDDARMRVILHALKTIGFHKEAETIRRRWNELIHISGSRAEAEYQRCYPNSVLNPIAELALEGVRGIGCNIAMADKMPSIIALLNEAWQKFWQSPAQFPTWERNEVQELRKIVAR